MKPATAATRSITRRDHHRSSDSDHRRRFVESGIALHAPLYLVGQARERADVVAPEIAADKEAPHVPDLNAHEEKVRAGPRLRHLGVTILGLIVFIAGFALRNGKPPSNAGDCWPQYAGLVAVYVALALIGWIWMAFNSLVGLRTGCSRHGR